METHRSQIYSTSYCRRAYPELLQRAASKTLGRDRIISELTSISQSVSSSWSSARAVPIMIGLHVRIKRQITIVGLGPTDPSRWRMCAIYAVRQSLKRIPEGTARRHTSLSWREICYSAKCIGHRLSVNSCCCCCCRSRSRNRSCADRWQ
jgi:hypothetical protein